MFRSIRFKLFLTFLTTTLLIVASMFFFTRWSLQNGFAEWVETRLHERETNLIDALDDYYASQQSWEKLSENKRLWIDLLLQSNLLGKTPSWLNQALSESNNNWPPALSKEDLKTKRQPFELRVMLLDKDKKIIFGREEAIPQLTLSPIYHQSEIVGFIGLLPGKGITKTSDIRFLEQQFDAFIWISLLMIFISGCLALSLAYLLGRPIKQVIMAIKSIAIGKYHTRLPQQSKDELGQLALNFNDLAIALEHSEQARRSWVADISHELRTPVAILRGELEALQDGIRPLTPQAIDSLYADVMRLNRLTEDLYQLTLTGQSALSYHKTRINPIDLLEEDLNVFTPDFQNKQLKISIINELANAVYIYADADRISQLFRNLLTNSLNYTYNNGQLDIRISCPSDYLTIEFSDSAPGVNEQDLAKLFDRFYRVSHSDSHQHQGAGLGLAISNNIVKAHNGRIQALPSALGGLTILINIPVCL